MKTLTKISLSIAAALTFTGYASAQNLSFSGGLYHSAVLCTDGLVYTTGSNAAGQLGQGATPTLNSFNPVLSSNGSQPLQGIWMVDAGSGQHNIALSLCGDTVWTWGSNDEGQLGDGTQVNSDLPVMVAGVGGVGQLSGIRFISAGNAESYAITNDGYLLSWGDNDYGQLGHGTTSNFEPYPNYVLKGVNDTLSSVTFVDGGDDFSIALTEDGVAYFWGSEANRNEAGPDPNSTASTTYADIILDPNGDTLTDIVRITAGDVFALIQTSDGAVYSFGHNWAGALGDGTTNAGTSTRRVLGIGGTGYLTGVKSLAAGNQHGIAVLWNGYVVTWGLHKYGQIGDGTVSGADAGRTYPDYVMLNATDTMKDIVDISEGDMWSFALQDNGDFYLWGWNNEGQLGFAGADQGYPVLNTSLPCDVGFDVICPIANIENGGISADTLSFCGSVVGTLTAGSVGNYTYRWFLDGTEIADETGAAITIDQAGMYVVEITAADTLCDGTLFCGEPSLDTLVVQVDGLDVSPQTLCMPATADLTVGGAGSFAWYANAEGGDTLGTGSTYTTGVLTTDTVFYVQDTALANLTVGYIYNDARIGGTPGQSMWINNLHTTFDAFSDFTLDSLSLGYQSLNGCTNDTTMQVIQLENVTDATTQTATVALLCSQTNQEVRVAVNFNIEAGKSYEITLDGGNGNILYHDNGADFSGDLSYAGILNITGAGSKFDDNPRFGPFYNWTITYQESCGRTPVYVYNGNNLATSLTETDTICGNETATLDPGTFDSYLWSAGATTQTIEADSDGKYYVTVSTAGCSTTDSTNIVIGGSVDVSLINDTICSGETATIDPGVFAGYVWSEGSTTQQITVGTANTYAVTVSNAAGCEGTASMALIVTPLPSVSLTDTSVCQANLTALTIGELSGYDSYLWSTGETNGTISVDADGNYSVTVTTDNCSASDDMDVNLFAKPTVALSDDIICPENNASIDAGAGQAAYLWSDGETTPAITANAEGDYHVTITDINGCTDRDTMTLSHFVLSGLDIDNQLICLGNDYTADPGAYSTYLWSNGSSLSTLTVTDEATYGLTVTDGNGCQETDEFTLTVLTPASTLLSDTTICPESTLTLNPGASGSLTYLWSTGASSQTIDVSEPGAYSVTISDGNDCENSASMTLGQHASPVADLGGDDAICDVEELTLDPGTFTTYLWNSGASDPTIIATVAGDYSVTITDANGCIDADSMNLTVHTLPVVDLPTSDLFCPDSSYTLNPGTFAAYDWSTGDDTPALTVTIETTISLTVTDDNGCNASSSTELTQYQAPEVLALQPDEVCSNETITLSANGGFVSYLWSTGATTANIDVNLPNTYSVTVSDGLCGWEASTAVDTLALPSVDIPLDVYVKCPRSATILQANGDAGLYSWSTGDEGNDLTTIEVSTGDQFYYVTLTDATTGCSTVAETFVSNEPIAQFEISDSVVCPGITIDLTVNPDPSYVSYLWSTGATTNAISTLVEANMDLNVTVTDVNGCEIIDNDAISLSPAAIPSADVATRGVPICNNDPDAAIEVTIDGGNAPFSIIYAIDDIRQTPIEGIDTTYYEFTGIEENTYTILEIRDQYNCVLTDFFDTVAIVVTDIDVAADFATPQSPSCLGVNITLTNASTDNVIDWTWNVYTNGDLASYAEPQPTILAGYEDQVVVELIVTEGDYNCSTSKRDTLNICNFDDCMVINKEVNVFTPDGDGVNDELDFDPSRFYDECINLMIYDRWGRTMYESPMDDIENSWDGNTLNDGLAPAGTYYYLLDVQGRAFKGSATLIKP